MVNAAAKNPLTDLLLNFQILTNQQRAEVKSNVIKSIPILQTNVIKTWYFDT